MHKIRSIFYILWISILQRRTFHIFCGKFYTLLKKFAQPLVVMVVTYTNCEADGQELLLCTFHILTKKPLLLGSDRNLQKMAIAAAPIVGFKWVRWDVVRNFLAPKLVQQVENGVVLTVHCSCNEHAMPLESVPYYGKALFC